jgi:hypothetical protein
VHRGADDAAIESCLRRLARTGGPMKRNGAVVVAVLVLLLAAPARPASIGAGVFGGASIPIVQEDTGSGPQFGIRVPVNLVPLLTIEPFFARSGLGDVTETFGGIEYQRSGFDVNAFGVNLIVGGAGLVGGLPFYPFAGIASHSLSRDGSDDIKEVGYELGLGVGFSVPPGVGINVRGGFDIVVTGDTSRKFINATLGLSYKLAGLP